MSETAFPVNDLLRRKLQTTLVVVSLALSVGSTLFLLLFAESIGSGLSLTVEDKLSLGFSHILSPFILLLTVLIIGAGVVMVFFMISLMMSQRVRDIGLIKAVGCPCGLVFGYFLTELLIIVFLGCFLGICLGALAGYASSNFLSLLGFQVGPFELNLGSIVVVFVLFLAIGLGVGATSIFRASRTSPVNAMCPEYRFGTMIETEFRALSSRRMTLAVALRGVIRRRSATVNIVLCMSIVFTLVTVGIAGGLIANQTTQSWVEKAIGTNIVLVAQTEMCDRYALLLKQFYANTSLAAFNYMDPRYMVPQDLIAELAALNGDAKVEKRFVTEATVREVQGYVLGETSQDTQIIGDNREGKSLIIGIDPQETLGKWYIAGRQLGSSQSHEVVVGDTLSGTLLSDPLVQKLRVFGSNFDVVGVCIDPLNNGNVTYVNYDALRNATGILGPNIVLLSMDPSSNKSEMLQQINSTVKSFAEDFGVLDLDDFLTRSLGFLGYTWSTVMIIPLFSLVSASLCLVCYVTLAVDEQRHEFGVMRAVGAQSKNVFSMIFEQSLLILLSSYGIGISIGTIVTLLILIHDPFITNLIILQIAGLQTAALMITLLSSLYPALRFARKPLIEVLGRD
ncbi:ABC transporter permease [Candidatus Bathyarchaeota archaeon]|nr:ABC transporter permease [Candidatus Bathyarchaeota archaeon]